MKKIALLTVFAAGALSLSAQNSTVEEKVEYSKDKYKVETNRFWSNWFISAGAGVNFGFTDHDKQADFGKRISPALDIAVGKWFTPGIGLRLMYSGLNVKGASNVTQDGPSHTTGKPMPEGKGSGFDMQYQKFNFYNLHGDVLFNLSNLLCGYNEKRIWNCSPYVGIGWGRVWDSPQFKGVTANLGVLNTFRLNDWLDANLDIRGMMTGEGFDGAWGSAEHDGVLSATVGLTYKFKRRGWDRSKTVYRYDYGDLESMRNKLNEMNAENERLKKELAQGKMAAARETVKRIASANLVTFPIGKSKLSNEARANLGMLAEVIKAGDKNAVYTITGYADAGTGSKRINEKLSKARAEAVYECLVEEFGIDKAQLKIDYKGGVENMFYDDPRLSRAVITRAE